MTSASRSECVLDSVVAGFVIRGDSRAALFGAWLDSTVTLPAQVVAELRYGALVRAWGPRRMLVLESFILGCRIALADEETAAAWARLRHHARGLGVSLSTGDAWIAATALQLELPLVTHDRDFSRLQYPGLTVVCPAEGEG